MVAGWDNQQIKSGYGLYYSNECVEDKMCSMERNGSTPILVPIEPEKFWEQIRLIIREEIISHQKTLPEPDNELFQTTGLTYKPLYKMSEVCKLFQITRPTV